VPLAHALEHTWRGSRLAGMPARSQAAHRALSITGHGGCSVPDRCLSRQLSASQPSPLVRGGKCDRDGAAYAHHRGQVIPGTAEDP
jgi:hypothetical protein